MMRKTFTQQRLFFGNILNPISEKRADFIPDGALLCEFHEETGSYRISKVGTQSEVLRALPAHADVLAYDYGNQIIMPGFADIHFHWVQDDVRLMPKDSLLDWLKNYTWPTEAKYKDKIFAINKAKDFRLELISNGTLAGGCYASIHEHTVDLALRHFVGDFVVGNVLMTMNSPDYLSQSVKQARKLVENFTTKYKNKYAVTPRFAPTTDPELMALGAKLAKKSGSFIQSHLAETKEEIDFVLSHYHQYRKFSKIKSYTEIYEKCGLLGSRTIMGHGIYLSPAEWKVIKQTKTVLAHCPTSNAPLRMKGLGSGLFDYQLANKHKVRWALASDIGGGPYLSMFDVMNMFVKLNQKNHATYTQALYRATLAGYEALGREGISGNFTSGKQANFIVVNGLESWKKLSAEELIKRLIGNVKRDQYSNLVQATFFQGQEIFSKN